MGWLTRELGRVVAQEGRMASRYDVHYDALPAANPGELNHSAWAKV
jgi:hypothetical protein